MWLTDLLPSRIGDARVLSFNYQLSGSYGLHAADIRDTALALLRELEEVLEGGDVSGTACWGSACPGTDEIVSAARVHRPWARRSHHQAGERASIPLDRRPS